MNIILRQDIENLGRIGELVSVKDGYARNYLIPQGMAYFASPKAVRLLETEKKHYEAKMAKLKAEAEDLASKLADLQITIAMQTGEENRLFGSVTNVMIAHELSARGYNIDRRTIIIDEPIKTTGVFEVRAKLHTDVVAPFKVWVTSAS